ncbi:hypothetical protein [Paracoccus actinidiae]|jgi:hypothetical protein|uniref:hypothetical protein n=1 Tax=Paracoccus actinidiae TaxID=3064531 RepID=UPI0027D2DAC3|nr:hypothetical protein [Paracoccus sp. M09]
MSEGWGIVLGALIAAFVGVLSGYLNNLVSYKSIAVEAITKERITWLDELRAIAVELTTKLAAINRTNKPATEEAMESADRVLGQLQLHLNPEGELEKTILRLANELQKFSEKSSVYRDKETEFMLAVRQLLKTEWEKAKNEAGVKKKGVA